MPTRTSRAGAGGLLSLVAALALLAAACGGGGGEAPQVASLDADDPVAPVAAADLAATDETAATATTVPLSQEEALLAFAQCMRDNGVDVPDPEMDSDGNVRLSRPDPGGNDFDREAAQAARAECAEYLDAARQGFRDRDRTEFEDELLTYARCMRDKGYEEMADPDFSNLGAGGGPGGGPFGALDREDPDFIAADEACRDLFGGQRPGPGRGPGGGGGG